mmetsp:Transcript_50517/g.108230  ORF Transcript_50517/g.108230 Transcript_50517/m.108230 type:complete len:230 (+) Transcript_50517:615-1304(+)
MSGSFLSWYSPKFGLTMGGRSEYFSRSGIRRRGCEERSGQLLDSERSGKWSPALPLISMRPIISFSGLCPCCLPKGMFLLSAVGFTAPMFTLYRPGWKYVSRSLGLETDSFAKSHLGFLVRCEHWRSPSKTPAVKELSWKWIPAAFTKSGRSKSLAILLSRKRFFILSGTSSRSSTLLTGFTRCSHGSFSACNLATSFSSSICFRLFVASFKPKSEPLRRGRVRCSSGR